MATTKKPTKKSSPKKTSAKKPAKQASVKASAKKTPVKKPAKKTSTKKPAKAAGVKVDVQVNVTPIAAPATPKKRPEDETTHITIVLDRSGSMSRIAGDMMGGLTKFLDDQRKAPGKCFVSLVQFDDTVEKVFTNVPIANVGRILLSPRGSTALYDGIIAGMEVAKSITADKQVFVVITDGEENASREHRLHHVVAAMEEAKTKDWAAMFLGANFDALKAAKNLGFHASSAVVFSADTMSVNATTDVLSSVTRGYRSGQLKSSNLYSSSQQNQKSR